MQVFDTSNPVEFDKDFIAWPSEHRFPVTFFSPKRAWSVMPNPSRFDVKRTGGITVELKRENDGRTWKFSRADNKKDGKYFNVDTQSFGVPICIIFRPADIIVYSPGDEFSVSVLGVFDKKGKEVRIRYATRFFFLF
jgi:hypothetical protein